MLHDDGRGEPGFEAGLRWLLVEHLPDSAKGYTWFKRFSKVGTVERAVFYGLRKGQMRWAIAECTDESHAAALVTRIHGDAAFGNERPVSARVIDFKEKEALMRRGTDERMGANNAVSPCRLAKYQGERPESSNIHVPSNVDHHDRRGADSGRERSPGGDRSGRPQRRRHGSRPRGRSRSRSCHNGRDPERHRRRRRHRTGHRKRKHGTRRQHRRRRRCKDEACKRCQSEAVVCPNDRGCSEQSCDSYSGSESDCSQSQPSQAIVTAEVQKRRDDLVQAQRLYDMKNSLVQALDADAARKDDELRSIQQQLADARMEAQALWGLVQMRETDLAEEEARVRNRERAS